MGETVYVERGVACRGMNSVVQRKFNNREHGASTHRRISANTAQNIINDAINTLSLTIGLRMILYGHVQTGAEHLEDGLPKLPREAGISIRDNYHWKAMLSKHTVDKHLRCTFGINRVRHCR